MPWWIKGIIAVFVLSGVGVVGLSLANTVPTRIDPLRNQYTPQVVRGEHAPSPERCGLTEVRGADGACIPAKPSSVDEIEVSFPSRLEDKGLPSLNGTLSVPRGLEGKRPGVVLIHGSGPNKRDAEAPGDLVRPNRPAKFPLLKTVADILSQQGLVVLRYDKRSCGNCYPEGKLTSETFQFTDFTDDARDGLAFLQTREEVDPHALVVVGHSQGGKHAPHVAHDNPDVAAVVMLAGAVQSLADAIVEQLGRAEQMRRDQWDLIGAWTIAFKTSALADCVGKLDGQYDPQDQCLGGGVTLAAVAAERGFAAQTLDKIRTLHCPLLVLQGNLDRNVQPDTPEIIAKATTDRDVEIHFIADAGHLLNDLTDLKDPPEFHPEVVAALGAFLARVPVPERSRLDGRRHPR